MGVLSETEWDGRVASVREERNKLCELMGLPQPKKKVAICGGDCDVRGVFVVYV